MAQIMEIPQNPGSQREVTRAVGGSQIPSNLVSLAELRLVPEKTYTATAVGRVDAEQALARAQVGALNVAEPPPPAFDKGQAEIAQWLVKLNGKVIVVSTELPLQRGQQLIVRIGQGNELLVQLGSGLSAALPVAGNARLNDTTLVMLLNAINQVMPRQVSLATGLEQLSRYAAQQDGVIAAQAKLVLAILSKQFPDTAQLVGLGESQIGGGSASTTVPESGMARLAPQTTTLNFKGADLASATVDSNGRAAEDSQPTASPRHKDGGQVLESLAAKHINYLVSALKQSGLFFESKLTSGGGQLSSQLAEIVQIRTGLEALSSLFSLTSSTLNSPLANSVSLPSDQISQHTALDQNPKARPALEQLRAVLTLPLLKAALERMAMPETLRQAIFKEQQNLKEPKVVVTDSVADIKSSLFKMTAALSLLNGAVTPSTKSFVDASTELDLLKSPFNFPHPYDHNILKAQRILGDQELSTGQLLKLIAGMLNRIQFNQLNSLYQSHSQSSETSNVQSWFFELPVVAPNAQINTFNLRIDQQEDARADREERQKKQLKWHIALSFDLPELGAIYIQVNLLPPSVSSVIWADRQQTLALITREAAHFRARLNEMGLEVGEICCQKGQPNQIKTKLDRSLVDIKA